MTKHDMRDRFGPAFEASDVVKALRLSIKHGGCNCGKVICAYENVDTSIAFAGFVSAFFYLLDKGLAIEGFTATRRKEKT